MGALVLLTDVVGLETLVIKHWLVDKREFDGTRYTHTADTVMLHDAERSDPGHLV